MDYDRSTYVPKPKQFKLSIDDANALSAEAVAQGWALPCVSQAQASNWKTACAPLQPATAAAQSSGSRSTAEPTPEGTEFLTSRGISPAAIRQALDRGILRFTPDACLFIGFDQNGLPASAWRLGFTGTAGEQAMPGSAPAVPVGFPGAGADTFIVSSCLDALLAFSCDLDNVDSPTAIAAGPGTGSDSAWMSQAWVTSLLSAAEMVFIREQTGSRERDKNGVTQADIVSRHCPVHSAYAATGRRWSMTVIRQPQAEGRVFVGLLDGGTLTVDTTQPELMSRPLSALDFKAMTVVCGCGGGDTIHGPLTKVLSTSALVVIDADAINVIAKDAQLQHC
jgi:hypothetical protein